MPNPVLRLCDQDVTRRKFLIRHLNVVIRPRSSYNQFPNKQTKKKHGPQLKNIPEQCLVKQHFLAFFPSLAFLLFATFILFPYPNQFDI